MKQQFLDLNGLTELVTYLKKSITEQKEILPYASNKLFPSTGNVNCIYIDTATNSIYRWDSSNKKYEILAKAVKSVSISESTENGKITLTVDGVKTTVPIHGLKSAAYTESSAYATAAQGVKAESAVQSISLASGTNNGTVKLTVDGKATDNIAVKGLGSAAYTASSAYATAGHTHTKAQIGLGNVDNTADKDKSVKHATTADNATTAGSATTATNVSGENATGDTARHVWFSRSDSETKRVYNDNFKYNPATNLLTTNITGSAASANSVAWTGVTGKPSTFTPSAHKHDDSTITSLNASKLFGTIDIARLPHGALERCVIVTDDDARFKLTTADVQLGDTVKVDKTKTMYFVINESKLNSEEGYTVYTAGTATSVPWTGVTGRPSSMPASDVYAWAKAASKPSYTKSEVGLGNVDNTADSAKSVKYATSAGSAGSVAWANVSGKPAITGKQTRTLTASGPSGWKDATTDQGFVPDMAFMAYWNGAYSGSSSNLAYCNRGAFGTIVTKNAGDYAPASHSHHYAGSGSAGGSANSAIKLDTATAGSATQPVYFSGGKPVACSYTLGKSVPADAKFTDTNTWRGIQNNLTSDSTSDSLSAAQGKALKALVDGKAASSHTHKYAGSSSAGGSANSANKLEITASITGGNGNTTGYRLLKSQSLSAWNNYRATFIVNSRHEGCGVLSVGFGCNSATVSQANAYGEIIYFGLENSASVISDDSFQVYVSSDGKTAYLFEKYWDYSTLSITYLSGDFTVSNGTWTESIPAATYGALKAKTQINVARSVPWSGITGKPSSFTPSSHTHNYAGSSSAGGNANAAVKLANARKIGSASFDGTADITLSQMGLNVPVEITKADYLAKKKAGTLNANTYYNVIDEYDSANVINDSSVTANSAFSSTKSEKTYAKKSTLVTTTLTASKWTGSSAPYTYVLSVSGVTSSNIVEIDYASNASSAAIEAYQNAMLADGGQTTNQIIIKATEKPTVDIPITIVIRNDL